jgi:hypothetical protein
MAIQTRYAGDAQGITNVDAKTDGTLDTIIATGLTKSPTALKITGFGTFTAAESGTGGPVETILRSIAIDSTIVAYQVSSTQLSVLVEATGAGNATATSAQVIATRLQNLGGNIGLAANIYSGGGVTVTTSQGIKFA